MFHYLEKKKTKVELFEYHKNVSAHSKQVRKGFPRVTAGFHHQVTREASLLYDYNLGQNC